LKPTGSAILSSGRLFYERKKRKIIVLFSFKVALISSTLSNAINHGTAVGNSHQF